MAAPKRDFTRGQAGEVSRIKTTQRRNHTAADRARDTLPPTSGADLTALSSASEAQRRRIVEMLRAGPKTTLDFRRAGIMQSQTRIHELRRRGYDLPTVGRVTIADDEGYMHDGVALYRLIAEPAMEAGQ